MKQFACPVCLKTFNEVGSCPDCEAELGLKAQKVPKDLRRHLPKPRVPWTTQSVILAVMAVVGGLILVAAIVFFCLGFYWMMQA